MFFIFSTKKIMSYETKLKQYFSLILAGTLLTVSLNTNAGETIFRSKEYDDIKNVAIIDDASSIYNENLALIGYRHTYLLENKSPHLFTAIYQNFSPMDISFDKKNILNLKHFKTIKSSEPCNCNIEKSQSKSIIKIKTRMSEMNEQQKSLLSSYSFSCKTSKEDADLTECSKVESFNVTIDNKVSSNSFKMIENTNIQKIRFSSNLYMNNPFSGMNAGAIILAPIVVPVMAIGIGVLCTPEYVKGKKCSVRFG